MAQSEWHEAAERLFNRCKAQWRSDWRLDTRDQALVIAVIEKLIAELAAADEQLAKNVATMTRWQALMADAMAEVHELEKLLDDWRKGDGHDSLVV